MADQGELPYGNGSTGYGPVIRPETAVTEPFYPILHRSELHWDVETDARLRGELPGEIRKYLKPYQHVVHIHHPELALADHRVNELEVCMRAARAARVEEIGRHGPTVASVDLSGHGESRYERQHGRDDLHAALDLYPLAPELLKTTVKTLAEKQGVNREEYREGQRYGFEQPGAIILVDRPDNDPVGRKFSNYQKWRFPFYGSVDAPATFVSALYRLHKGDPSYLLRENYNSRDGNNYAMSHAFEMAVQWLVERTEANPEGLIEYSNPVKEGGMRNQGWRDSASAMVHEDGSWANSDQGVAPIEVQGFAFDAFTHAARIFRELYKDDMKAGDLEERARNIQKVVIEKGYVHDSKGGYFVSGFDRYDNGLLRQMRVRTSAMGRLLATGILKTANPEVQLMVWETMKTLLQPDMLTPNGLRTLSSQETAYVPFSYHVGPIWKQDNDECARGFSNHGAYGLDRIVGQATTNLHQRTGVFYEHVSGYGSETPHVPTRDTYVWDELNEELYLFEQAPPAGQTWAASSEWAKKHRYILIPDVATDPKVREVEKTILNQIEY
jgi:glycogen debranching enzyme